MTIRRTILITISPPGEGPPFMVDITRGPNPIVNIPTSAERLIATGGVPPYSFSLVSGTPPPGLTLGSDGVFRGTPTAQGRYGFSVQAQDSASQTTIARPFTFDIDPGLKTSGIVSAKGFIIGGAIGVAYNYQFRIVDLTGSGAGITYTLQSGTLPAGTTLNSSGLLAGTPTLSGVSSFVVRGTKSTPVGPIYLDVNVKLQINDRFALAGSITEISDGLKNMVVGVAVNGRLTLSWPFAAMPVGQEPYRWVIASGALPAGLTMNNLGGITGTPTAPTPFNYVQPTFTVTDGFGSTFNTTLSGVNSLVVAAAIKSQLPRKFLTTDATGNPQTIDFFAQIFGDGSDGAAVLDGTTAFPWADKNMAVYSLNRDTYLSDLSFSPGVSLRTNGFRLFGTGKLTLDGCAANTIYAYAANGGNANSGGPGSSGEIDRGTISGSLAGGRGGTGATSGAGTNPTPQHAYPVSPGNGGNVGNFGLPTPGGGNGGNGTSTNGSAGEIPDVMSGHTPVRTAFQTLMRGESMLRGGAPGYGGGYGGNDGVNRGGHGGGGGAGGGVAAIYFYEISTNGTTAARCINAPGGNGGNGFCSSASANIGGGGGGSGGGGGYVHLVYAVRTGASVASLVGASGGNGGSGAANSLNSARNGRGGDGASGGRAVAINVFDQSVSVSAAASQPSPQSGNAGAAGTAASLTL